LALHFNLIAFIIINRSSSHPIDLRRSITALDIFSIYRRPINKWS